MGSETQKIACTTHLNLLTLIFIRFTFIIPVSFRSKMLRWCALLLMPAALGVPFPPFFGNSLPSFYTYNRYRFQLPGVPRICGLPRSRRQWGQRASHHSRDWRWDRSDRGVGVRFDEWKTRVPRPSEGTTWKWL